MAESSARDVVIQALSVGDLSPADVPATHNNSSALGEEEVKQLGETQDHARDQAPQDLQNGGPVRPMEAITSSVRFRQRPSLQVITTEQDAHAAYATDQLPTPSNSAYTNGTSYHIPDNGSNATLHDASGGSDTDSSRPDGARGSQADGSNAAKKTTFRPVSFAKFSVNKVAAATPGVKAVTEKGEDTSHALSMMES